MPSLEPFPVAFVYEDQLYEGYLKPFGSANLPDIFHVVIEGRYRGNLEFTHTWQLQGYPQWAEILGYFAEAWWQ